MQPIFVGQKINQPREEILFKYYVPKELEDEIKRKLKAFSDGYSISIEAIQIKLTKPNDT